MTRPDIDLVITIDVEEDNWGFADPRPAVENIRKIPRLQALFDRYGIRPCYLITYPVASCAWSVELLSEIHRQGKCEIGAHLHPWNTPPLKEDINARNSMMKNLDYPLQVGKLQALTDKIETVFNAKPMSFRAGRWGLGADTVKALITCGYTVDCSVTPTMSWLNSGDGSVYLDAENNPHWLMSGTDPTGSDGGRILEVPVSIGFNRWPFDRWQRFSRNLQQNWIRHLRPIGFLHHTGLLRKIWLSPEISSARDMITLSNVMVRNGFRLLNLSFHSAALLPGKTPFVRNEQELEQFYARIETIIEHLASTTRLQSLTLADIARQYREEREHEGAAGRVTYAHIDEAT